MRGQDKSPGWNCTCLVHGRWSDDDPVTRLHQENSKDSAKRTQHSQVSTQTISGGRIMKRNKHIGSSFDEFLKDEGLLAEAEATAVKRILTHQIEKEMAERNISKSKLADIMQTSRSSLNRLLNPENPSVTLLTLESVALALGKKLKVQIS